MAVLAATPLVIRAPNDMTSRYHEGRIVGHIARDSTAILLREKPTNKEHEVAIIPKRKRGRPHKGESRPAKKLGRLERQLRMKPGKAVAELDSDCAWGCKKNSQGNVSFWKGYKLHLDVTDMRIPVTAVVTGANVHDSQVAIPMEKWTERKITYLYSVMDSAYDANEIIEAITELNHRPIIAIHSRRTTAEPFDPATKEHYKVRTVAERGNARLKDEFGCRHIRVRGATKVHQHVMFGLLALCADVLLKMAIVPI